MQRNHDELKTRSKEKAAAAEVHCWYVYGGGAEKGKGGPRYEWEPLFDELMRVAEELETMVEAHNFRGYVEYTKEEECKFDEFDKLINEALEKDLITPLQFNKLAFTAYYDFCDYRY